MAGYASKSKTDKHMRSFGVVPDSTTEVIGGERSSNAGVFLFSATVFLVSFAITAGLARWIAGEVTTASFILAVIIALLITSSVHIAQQWERAVILRFGRFSRVVGPGVFFKIPVIEQNTMRVDMRMRVTTFGAEETLTADLIPMNVNAVLFWTVWDPKAACLEVGDFTQAVVLAAQTALRAAIGRGGAAEIAIRREQLDRELKRALEEKVAQWGVTILSVEVRDILMPKELQDVMSAEAQAEQRKKARIILTEAEQDMVDMIEEVGKRYRNNDAAMRLRAMHLLYESVKDTGGTVVIPSSFSEGLGDVFPDDFKSGSGKPIKFDPASGK